MGWDKKNNLFLLTVLSISLFTLIDSSAAIDDDTLYGVINKELVKK